MAYARFSGKSEVYVWGDGNKLFCTSCRLIPIDGWYGEFYTEVPSAMLKHLQEHRQIGHHVPWTATRRIKREIRRYGDKV